MEKTNFTFVSPSRMIRAVLLLLVTSFSVSYASAQCTPPAGVAVVANCDGSLTVSWNAVPDANSYTLVVETFPGGLPVVNFVNMPGTTVNIVPGSLVPGDPYAYSVTANCPMGVAASTPGNIAAGFVPDLPPTIAISNVVPSSCPGAADGSFDVTVNDACGATYDITVGGVTQTAAAGATVTFANLPGSPAGTNYTVSLALSAAGGCVFNPACVAAVSRTVTLFSNDVTDPFLQVTDFSGAVVASGTSSTYVVPEGECGMQLLWSAFTVDNCGAATLTATITNANLGVFPGPQVTVLNNNPTYGLEIFAAIGTNVLTVTSTDASGNANVQTFTINVPDVRAPELFCPDNIFVDIPSCADDIPVNWSVAVTDDCDAQPNLVQTGGPASGTSLADGFYTVTYQATDDAGNTATCAFNITVEQQASPAPIVDVSGNGQFSVPACEAEEFVILSGNIISCDINPANPVTPLDITVNGAPLVISFVTPAADQDGSAYFEATGPLVPGTYLVFVTYDGVTGDHLVDVVQDADQPATITMPGNLNALVPVCAAGANLSFQVQISDDCDDNLAGATFTLNGGAAPAIDAGASDPANGVYAWNLTGIPAGNYTLAASYTDGAGNVSTASSTFVVTGQPDIFAPIVIYPSQNQNVVLDPCGASTAAVDFNVSAYDNCDGDVTPTVTISSGSVMNLAGNTWLAMVDANTNAVVTITATDVAGNTRTESFQINVTQAAPPQDNLACNDDLFITLDGNCERQLTAEMVLEGNFGCLTDADFSIDIKSAANGQLLNSNGIVPGAGQFVYDISLSGVAQPVNGFTSDFAPNNWGVTTNAGNGTSTVTFTNTTLTLATLAGQVASAFIAMPSDGTLSFNYDYNGSDPNFDFFIIDLNGTVVANVTAAASGTVNEQVEAGWVLALTVDDDGFNPIGPNIPSTAVISSFLFQPAGAAGVNFPGCWGFVTGEDKTPPTIECPPNTGTGTIVKNGFRLSGSIDNTDPTIVLEDHSCLIDNAQGTPGLTGERFVDVQSFQVDRNDIYTFLVQSQVTALGNVGFAIYQGSYDPDSPCENIIAQSDIPQTLTGGAGGGNPLPGSQNFDPSIRLSLPLQAGQTYFIATSTYFPGATGTYEYSICSDGNGRVGFFDTTVITNPDWTTTTIVNFTPLPTAPVTIQARLHCGDLDLILNNPASLAITGSPVAADNCGPVTTTFTDTYTQSGDCGDIFITRTFTTVDAKGNSASCVQTIRLFKVTFDNIFLPPFTVPIECDEEEYETLANGNPAPSATGYPFVFTASGIFDLKDSYCNVGASFQDGPRINVCDGAYKFVRTWTIINWCNPLDQLIVPPYQQVIKVGDFTAPEVQCPAGTPLVYSTSPFSCLAAFQVPMPVVSDNCSSTSVLTEIVTTVEEEILTHWGAPTGQFTVDTIVVRTVQPGANRFVSGIPVGSHFFRYTVNDACGNKTVRYCPFVVADQIAPVAVCDDELNISIGGATVMGEALARITAADVDEGSWDNCELASIDISREITADCINTYAQQVNRMAWPANYRNVGSGSGFDQVFVSRINVPERGIVVNQPLIGRKGGVLYSFWSNEAFFTCCDIGTELKVELRAIDASGNQNIGWLVTTPEDKLRPICVAPANMTIDCDQLPLGFDVSDEGLLNDLFGTAEGLDNCSVETVEQTGASANLECRAGSISRSFRVTDHGGLTATCNQTIIVRKVHNYEIKFPKDAEAICGVAEPDSVTYNEIGCDLLAVSHTDEFFAASGDECYKIFRTWRVINWCEYDGQSPAIVLGRDENCSGTPGDDCFWLLRRPSGKVFIDKDNIETPGNNVPGFNPCNFQIRDFYRKFESNRGFWQYTQHIKVYDDIAPVITFDQPDPFCSLNNVDCDALVTYPFKVDEECTPNDLTITVELNAFLGGSFTPLTGVLSGTFPDYTIRARFPIGNHAFRVTVEDGCGNFASAILPFSVIDCKAPTPICINGLAVELMPVDLDGDNLPDPGAGMAEVWASDFLVSPNSDCTGPIKYSMNVAGEPNDPNVDGLFFDCDDEGTVVVEIWAYDGAGNGDFCETYVLVQDNMEVCGDPAPGIAGAVNTEANDAVSDVEVNLSGQMSDAMTTANDGLYGFSNLQAGMDYTVAPQRDGDYLNGVSTFDLVLISKHILGVQPLDSPYKMIAADVNSSKSITTLDLIQLRKLILSIDTEFSNNTSWRFVEAAYVFPNPSNPWAEDFPEVININDLPTAGIGNAEFVAVKIGDVNGDAQANNFSAIDDRSIDKTFALSVAEDVAMKAGNEYSVVFTAADLANIEGYQATLTLGKAVELVDIVNGIAAEENFGLAYAGEGMITTSWNGDAGNGALFTLVLRANADVQLSEVLGVSSAVTKAEAYGKDGSFQDVAIVFGNGTVASLGFELYQNMPNPFKSETAIGFNLPEAGSATLTISDITGRVLKQYTIDGAKGYNQIDVNAAQLPASGVVSYTLESGKHMATKTMVIVE